ncbi:conjugal transfer protein TraH [Ursidibacter arcticus]
MKWLKKSWLATIIAFSSVASADVNSDLNDFFNRLGGGSNASSGGVFKAQSAGHLVGGSFYGRVPVRNIQLISITMPEINAGCGGIDAYLGAFSFINTDQLKAMGKAILSNAVGYAFELALETTCPTCKSVKDYLQELATTVNNLNISTCQAAQGIVGGLWGKSEASRTHICNKLANENNVFADWAKARQECGVGGQSERVFNSAKNDRQREEIPRNRNVTWHALNKINQVVSNDRQLKELMMSIVGSTVYGKTTKDRFVLPPLGANENLLNALLYGGEATFYACDESTLCLKPKKSTITIQKNRGLVTQVEKILYSMYESMKNDTPPTAAQKELIENTRVPLAAYVRDVAMFNGNSQMITNLSEYLAVDFALGYIDNLMSVTELASATGFTTDEEERQFKENIQSVRMRMGQLLSKITIKNDAFISSLKNLETLKKQLSHELINKINFGG